RPAPHRTPRLPPRPPANRAAALPRAGGVAAVAGGAVAGYARGAGPGGGVPACERAAAGLAGRARGTGHGLISRCRVTRQGRRTTRPRERTTGPVPRRRPAGRPPPG